MRFSNEIIKKNEEKIAKALELTVRCDEFGNGYKEKDKDCLVCGVDEPLYHTKCRQFTKGVGPGRRRKRPNLPRVIRKKKLKKYKEKVEKEKTLFRRGTRKDIVYNFIKSRESTKLEDIMKYLYDLYGESASSRKNARILVYYIRKELSKYDYEIIKNYRGHYFMEKTVKGKKNKGGYKYE